MTGAYVYVSLRRFSLTLVSSTFFLVAASSAQDTLAPVTVTATRIPTRADLVSSAITVLTRAQLRQAGYRTVADALRNTPAASVVESGSFGGQTSLFLRGGESDYVKVLLDGVTLNVPGGAFDFADLSLENVERIEVVRGPGSVLYGSDAVTGVVQIITRTGSGHSRVSAEARAGTFGAVDLSGGIQGSAGRVGYSAELGRFAADGQLPFNNQYERSVGSARLRLAPDARTDINLNLRYADATYHYPTDGAGRLADSNQFRYERGPVWSADAGYDVSPAVTLRLSYGVKHVIQGLDDRADNAGDTTGFYGFQSEDTLRRATLGARVDWRVARTTMTFGAELERQSLDGRSLAQSQFGDSPDSLHPRRSNDAVYVQALTGGEGPFSLQGGARLDANQQFGRFLTVRAGSVYRLSPESRLRAAVATGFKEPTFFENFATGFVLGNPDLLPERTRSWEVGLEQRFGRTTLDVGYFDQAFQNLIEFTSSPAPPDTRNYFNVTGATADGVEAELRTEWGRGWLASLRYTYLDTRVTDPGFDTSPDAAFAPGKSLLRRPANQLGLRFEAPVAAGGRATLNVRYSGERDDLDFTTFPAVRVTLPAATWVDLAAEYAFRVGSGLAVVATARVENLFDDQSREAFNVTARGRVVFLGGQIRTGP